MMRTSIAALFAAALCSCGAEPASENPTGPASSEAGAQAGDKSGAGPLQEPPATRNQSAEPAGEATIPVVLRGRWGMTAEDCTSTRGDAKGLLEISEDRLRFYESRATPTHVVEKDASRMVADFDFSGEGQRWQRRLILDVEDNGRTLIHRDQGPDAAPGPFRYRRCESG